MANKTFGRTIREKFLSVTSIADAAIPQTLPQYFSRSNTLWLTPGRWDTPAQVASHWCSWSCCCLISCGVCQDWSVWASSPPQERYHSQWSASQKKYCQQLHCPNWYQESQNWFLWTWPEFHPESNPKSVSNRSQKLIKDPSRSLLKGWEWNASS